MGFVKAVLGLFESPNETIKGLKNNPDGAKMFFGAMIFFSAIYGLVYGFLAGDASTAAWYLIKFPATLFLSGLVPYITLYIIIKVFGIKMSPGDLVASLSITFAIAMIVAIAILPLNVLYTYTGHSPAVIHSFTLFISIIAGLIYLAKTFRILGSAEEGTAIVAMLISAVIILFVMTQFVDLFFNISDATSHSGFMMEDMMRSTAQKTSIVR